MSTANVVTGQASVNSSGEVLVVPLRAGRRQLRLFSQAFIYIGPAGVTASTGFAVPPGGDGIVLETEAEVHAIAASTSSIVYFLEQF